MRNILYHGTGSWARILEDGFLSPSIPERVFSEANGSIASCGGVYLCREAAYPAYIADRAARANTLERTVVAVHVDENLLVPDEDVLSQLVTARLAEAGCDIPVWHALDPEVRGAEYRDTFRLKLLTAVARDIGCHGDPLIIERGVDALVDRIGGPWLPLSETEAAINAISNAFPVPASAGWIKEYCRHAKLSCRTFAKVGRNPGTLILGAVTASYRENGSQSETMTAIQMHGNFPVNALPGFFEGLDEAARNWDTELSYSPEVVEFAAGRGIELPLGLEMSATP